MSYKNNEGYPDPTAGKAVRAVGHMPTYIYNVSCALSHDEGDAGRYRYIRGKSSV